MNVSNPYLREEAVRRFESSTVIPPEALEAMGRFLVEAVPMPAGRRHRLLDVGSGTGRTVLGFLRGFESLGVDVDATCFDVSPLMLQAFSRSVSAEPDRERQIRVLQHDANGGLPDSLFPGTFDLVTVVSVLQYLSDWRSFASEIVRKLAPEGTLVLAELIGWYRLLDGTLVDTAVADPVSADFWRSYFAARAEYAPWEPEVSFSNLAPVLAHLVDRLGLHSVESREFLWDCEASWRDVLSWIKAGPVSSLGSGLENDASRDTLEGKMAEFLRERLVDPSKRLPVPWGFRLHLYRVVGG